MRLKEGKADLTAPLFMASLDEAVGSVRQNQTAQEEDESRQCSKTKRQAPAHIGQHAVCAWQASKDTASCFQ
jgi:hypothetical protein